MVSKEEAEIIHGLQKLYSDKDGKASEMLQSMQEAVVPESESDTTELLENQENSAPVVRLLNLILKEAIEERASDIHFDPVEDLLRIRYRIDGVLHDRHAPRTIYEPLLLLVLKCLPNSISPNTDCLKMVALSCN